MTQLGTKKSRKGCTNCKRRRVKCNEQAPCANCSRRGESCSLLDVSLTTNETLPEQSGLPRSSEEWVDDLELMHHYDHDLLQPFGLGSESLHLWRDSIPQEALRHPFLMHGILALSALHIAYERPASADKYLRLSDKHQTRALELFRSVLRQPIHSEASTALFALSTTISILSMGRACADAMAMSEPRYITMEQVAELFLLTRGVRDLIYTTTALASAGPFCNMLDGHNPVALHTDVHLPPGVQKQFYHLRNMLTECCSLEHFDTCTMAVHQLETVYRSVISGSSHIYFEDGQIWKWMLLVPQDFIRLVSARFPPALIILGYFAAVSTSIQKAWYMNDWGQYVLSGIYLSLFESDMHGHLEWPMEHARSGMTILTQAEEIDSVMNDTSPPATKLVLERASRLDADFTPSEWDLTSF